MELRVQDATPAATPGWALSLYPDALEASGVFVSTQPRRSAYVARGKAADPARAAAEAARRARATLRRFAAANRLNRLGTLTYGEPRCSDPVEVRRHVGLFFRRLRASVGGRPLPYAWVPELHADGKHFHVHFAVGRFVHRSKIEAAWGRGFVHIKALGDLPVGSGTVEEARRAAGYLSKYVAKSFTDPRTRALGMHRYDLAQGFQPRVVRFRGARTSEDLLRHASLILGSHPVRRWSSDQVEDWAAPPAIWAQWAA